MAWLFSLAVTLSGERVLCCSPARRFPSYVSLLASLLHSHLLSVCPDAASSSGPGSHAASSKMPFLTYMSQLERLSALCLRSILWVPYGI